MQEELSITDALAGREVIYSCLSRAFLEMPSEEIYKMLETILPDVLLIADGSENKLLVDGAHGIEKFLKKRADAAASDLSALDDEEERAYTRLFCLTDSVAISESVYTSVEHLSMQGPAGEVQWLYDACKFDMKNSSNEPPDHISYELMFMAYLSKGTRKHIEAGSEDKANDLIKLQREFLSNHLLKWAPDFVKKTISYPASAYLYAPLAYFMLGYLQEDSAFLAE